MAAGLFYVYTEAGSLDEAEFRARVVASALRRERRAVGLRNPIRS